MGAVWTVDGKKIDTPRVRAAVFVPCKAEAIAPVLDSGALPIKRCLAAKVISPTILRLFFSRSMVENMRAVARRLCPVLVERALNTPGISLRMLVYAAYGRTPEEQIHRWNDYLLRGKEDKPADYNPQSKG